MLEKIWMETFTGKRVFPFAMTEDMVDIEDIAQSLSLMCRWNGHISAFFSIAQHCVLASLLVEDRGDLPLHALLHDAGEAYVSDVPKPLKIGLRGFDEIEAGVMSAIRSKFGLEEPDGNLEMPPEVKAVDEELLVYEIAALKPKGSLVAERFGDPVREVPITPWPPDVARKEYLKRFKELTHVCN